MEQNADQSQTQYANMPQTPPPMQPGGNIALGQLAGQPPGSYPSQLAYQHLQQQQQRQMQEFWLGQMQDVEEVTDFKTHSLPLARIKKIMKADEDVRMISAEAPVLFAKACEMFILELTLRAWMHTEENKRRTLQKNDIAAAVTRTDIFDFLVDIVPRDELKEEGLGVARSALPIGTPADAMQYYLPPPGVIMGRPAMPMDPSIYQQRPNMPYLQQQWPQQQPQDQQQQQQQQQQQPPPSSATSE